jgi:aryl-alcohol dehydrogenase-like predicted oxidoreductase
MATHTRLDPLERPVCRLVLGTSFLRDVEQLYVDELFDAYVRLGGNAFDTALVYHNVEQRLGDWMRRRGNRDDLVIHAKGVHSEGGRRRVTPADIRCDLNETLTRLAVQAVDVFTLHRDDTARPVGPLLECLAEARDAGHLRCYGASNWSPGRLEEADDYAESRGLARFALSSPQFSLAVPNEPSWPGCLDARDAQSRLWYERTQRPLFAWSALALGFFTGRYEPRESLDPAQVAALEADPWSRDVLRVFYSADNFRRRARAAELAAERGVSATQIALAWVLHQPLAIFAVVGPRSVPELEELFAVFDISLAPTELAWLDLGTERE